MDGIVKQIMFGKFCRITTEVGIVHGGESSYPVVP